jgi:tRNA(fMet)-specific endonuclease VapC
MFILDTDHVSLWLRNNPLVRAKVDASAQDVSLTVITVQELFNGWVSRLNTTADSGLMLERYASFCQTIEFVKQFPVLNFEAQADREYTRILLENPNLRKKRLRQDPVARGREYRESLGTVEAIADELLDLPEK